MSNSLTLAARFYEHRRHGNLVAGSYAIETDLNGINVLYVYVINLVHVASPLHRLCFAKREEAS